MSLLLAAAALLASLALAEGVLRLAGFSHPNFFVPDPRFGLRLRPGIEGWQRQEGEAYVRITQRGLRDRDRPLDKPPGTVRVAVLGDSFTEAMQVSLEDTFPALLEQRLNACDAFPGRAAEVLNFGVSNYGTAQQLLLLRDEVWRWSPDVVLLAFFQGNDVRNNSRALDRGTNRPFFVLDDRRLELDDSFLDEDGFRRSVYLAELLAPLQQLRLYQLARKARAALRKQESSGENRQILSEPGLDDAVLRPPPDARWEAAWTVTERLVRRMSEETRARGARFVLATLSMGATVHPDREARERYAAALGVPDLFYPERRLLGLGKRAGFDAIALAPEMQRHAEATGSYLHGFHNSRMGFGHWNAEGHRLAAELLARHFC